MESGQRVGAICGARDGVVEFFGYGVYEGDFVPGDDKSDPKPVGWVADMREAMATMAETGQSPNPRIRLDSGEIVWGCECWWGPEEEMRRQLMGYKEIVHVTVAEKRKAVASTLP